jgi:hypothetical protein
MDAYDQNEHRLRSALADLARQLAEENRKRVEFEEKALRYEIEIARLTEHGLFTEEEIGTTCCFALQDKVWVSGPDDERWEVYTKLADSETFFEVTEAEPAGDCCG